MSSASRVSPAEELAAFLARSPSPQEIAAFRLSDAALAHTRLLLDKNEDGLLTPEESRELDRLVLLDDIIALIQLYTPSSNGESSGGAQGEQPDATEAGNGHAETSGPRASDGQSA